MNLTKTICAAALTLNFLLSSFNCIAQLDTVHWIPPLHSGLNGQIEDHYIYLSTPITTPFVVTIKNGAGIVLATPTISNATPFSYLVGIGQASGSPLFVARADLNTVLTTVGVTLTASQPFYANVRAREPNQADWATSKGKSGLGTTFRFGGFPQFNAGPPVGFGGASNRNFVMGIMATQNNTTVTISGYNPAVTFDGVPIILAPPTVSIVLNQGECYVVAGGNNFAPNRNGFMGALIQSDKPIAVNNGNMNGTIHPTNTTNQDMGFDLSIPIERLGKDYVLVEGQGIANMESPIVVAHSNNTEIYINGSATPITTINAGNFFLVPNTNYQGTVGQRNMYIRTSEPAYVYQALAADGSFSTGGLVLVPPLNCFLPNSIDFISAIDSIGATQYTSGVLITTELGATVQINGGAPLTGAEPVLGASWETYKILNLTGNIAVTSSGGLAVSVLGLGSPAGFAGYFSGFSTVPLLSNFTYIDTCFSSLTTFNATIDSLDGVALPDSVIWNFNDPASGINNTANGGNVIHQFTAPGTYTVQMIVFRCQNDTIIKTITILPVASGTDVQTVCNSLTWIDGITYTTSTNTPTFTLVGGAASGCDSVVTLNLTINSAASSTDVVTSCTPITWIDGITYSASTNTPTFTLVGGAASGCDSVVTLNLTINSATSSTDIINSCTPITWLDGINYTASTSTPTFTIINGAANGCDSLITLNLTINSFASGTDIINSCTPITWIDGINYSASTTTPNFTIVGGAANGCDSVVTLDLTITPIASTANTSICQGDSIFLGGAFQNTAGNYNDTLFGGAANGCDSVIITTLTLTPSAIFTQNPVICQGQTFMLPSGVIVNTTGVFMDTLQNAAANGCDSIVTTNLTVNPAVSFVQNFNECQGFSVTVGTNNYTTTGNFIDTLIASLGCDSVVTTNLIITIPTKTTNVLNECEGFSVTVGTNIYTTTGVFIDVINNCDTIVTDLTINPAPQLTLIKADDNCGENTGSVTANVISANPPITYIWNTGSTDSVINNLPAGTYTILVTDSGGCKANGQVIIETTNIECDFFVYVPNVFSPNGDGNNDVFFVNGKGITGLSVKIYNRWGNKVFEINNINESWDGKYKGSEQNTAVFVYVLEATFVNGKTVTESGNVSLIR